MSIQNDAHCLALRMIIFRFGGALQDGGHQSD
jgi:hypothetical protein